MRKDGIGLLSMMLLVANTVGPGLKLLCFAVASVFVARRNWPMLSKLFHRFQSSSDLPAQNFVNRRHRLR